MNTVKGENGNVPVLLFIGGEYPYRKNGVYEKLSTFPVESFNIGG